MAGQVLEVAQLAACHVALRMVVGSLRQGCVVCTQVPKRTRDPQAVRQQALLAVSRSGPQKALGNVKSWKQQVLMQLSIHSAVDILVTLFLERARFRVKLEVPKRTQHG